jgi:hypothetical protein
VSANWRERAGTPLLDRIVGLAGKADDNRDIGTDLVEIAVLSAGRVAGVSYASVTSRYEGAYATVAASSDLAVTVDEAQYADDAGPCLAALGGVYPVAVSDMAETINWPGFREVAFGLGLKASLSIPLFAGRGVAIAALNLYAHDPGAMSILTTAVSSVFEARIPADGDLEDLDNGGAELVAGLAGAFAVQTDIQQAMGVLRAETGYTADQAFAALRLRAADAALTLPEAAGRILAGDG